MAPIISAGIGFIIIIIIITLDVYCRQSGSMAADIYVSNARAQRASRASICYAIYDSVNQPRRPSLMADGLAAKRSSSSRASFAITENVGQPRRPSLLVEGLSIVDIIRKKRDDEELDDEEIQWFVSAATKGLITEAQIGVKRSRFIFVFVHIIVMYIQFCPLVCVVVLCIALGELEHMWHIFMVVQKWHIFGAL